MSPPAHRRLKDTLAERDQVIMDLATQLAIVWASLEDLKVECVALREGLRSLTQQSVTPPGVDGLKDGEQGGWTPLAMSPVPQRQSLGEPCLVKPNSSKEGVQVIPALLFPTPQVPPLIPHIVTPKLKMPT